MKIVKKITSFLLVSIVFSGVIFSAYKIGSSQEKKSVDDTDRGLTASPIDEEVGASTSSNDPLFVIPGLEFDSSSEYGEYEEFGKIEAQNLYFYNDTPWTSDKMNVALSIEKEDTDLWSTDPGWHAFSECVEKDYIEPGISAGCVANWQFWDQRSIKNVGCFTTLYPGFSWSRSESESGGDTGAITPPIWVHKMENKRPLPNAYDNPNTYDNDGHIDSTSFPYSATVKNVATCDDMYSWPQTDWKLHIYTSLMFKNTGGSDIDITDFIELKYEGTQVQMKFTVLNIQCFLEIAPVISSPSSVWYGWYNIDPIIVDPKFYIELSTLDSAEDLDPIIGDYIDIGSIQWTLNIDKIVIKNYGGDAVLDFNSDNLIITKIDGTVTVGREWCACLARIELVPTLVDNVNAPICPPFTDLDYQETLDFTDFHVTYCWWDPNNYLADPVYDAQARMQFLDFANMDRELGEFILPIQTV